MDWVLVVVVGGLSAIGVLLVWSATQPSLLAAGQDPRTYLKKQLLWVVIGLILMFAVSFADSRRLRAGRRWPTARRCSACWPCSPRSAGSQRGQGAGSTCPAASRSSRRSSRRSRWSWASPRCSARPAGATPGLRSVLLALAAAAPLMALVVIEPALGVALVLVVVTATMVVLSGTRLRILAALAAVVGVGVARPAACTCSSPTS